MPAPCSLWSDERKTWTAGAILLARAAFGWDDFADRFGMALLDALAYAHQRDVVHREVKPSNILIGKGRIPLLADFDKAASNALPSGRNRGR